MKLAGLLLLFSFLLPTTSQAYFTTDQSATRLTNETMLYTVTYHFGFSGRELYMPILAMRGLSASNTSPYAGYALINEDGDESEAGVATSIILTNQEDVEVRDNQYYLPENKSASFTLMTILTIPEEQQTENLALLVTNLPFTMVKDGTPIPAHLNPSELQYYTTPVINFTK